MKPILKWWDAGKPQGAPLEALMKEANDPLIPAVLQSKLEGNESCATCKKKKGEVAKLSRCGGCKIPVYCSAVCQRADWKSHRELCKATKNLAESLRDP